MLQHLDGELPGGKLDCGVSFELSVGAKDDMVYLEARQNLLFI